MALKIAGIYLIRNTHNKKVYVGQSRNTKQRWYDHRKALRRGNHSNPHLQSSWCKYGEVAFEFVMLWVESDLGQLSRREREGVAEYRATERTHGYNLSDGGEVDYRRSPETRARMAAAMRGKTHSPETRAKISAAKLGQGKGRKKSEKELEGLRVAHARRHTETEGYAWFTSTEGRAVQSTSGKKGAEARWRNGGGLSQINRLSPDESGDSIDSLVGQTRGGAE